MRLVARLLLVAYALFVLKPVMPVLIDGLAHAFWKNVHIAVVHTVNGKEHVHYELAKTAKDFDKDKSGGKSKAGTDWSSHLLAKPIAVTATAFPDDASTRYGGYAARLLHAIRERVHPPPKGPGLAC